jgi:hypothetical protein
VIYPSIENFTWSKKKYTFGGQRGENRPPEPKNGIWGAKSIWSCDISIDFTWSKKKYTFGSQKDGNKPPDPQIPCCCFAFISEAATTKMDFQNLA